MALLLPCHPAPSSAVATLGSVRRERISSSPLFSPSHSIATKKHRALKAKSFFNPFEDPVLKEAVKEPVAFMGGVFAGLLRLDLNEDPLKEWVSRTVEAAGITEEEIISKESEQDKGAPQQIEIE